MIKFYMNFIILFVTMISLNIVSNNIYATGVSNLPEETSDTSTIFKVFESGDYKEDKSFHYAAIFNEFKSKLADKKSTDYTVKTNIADPSQQAMSLFNVQVIFTPAEAIAKKMGEFTIKKETLDAAVKEKMADFCVSYTKDTLLPILDGKLKKEDAKGLQAALFEKIGTPEDGNDKETLYGAAKKFMADDTINAEKLKQMITDKKLFMLSGLFYTPVDSSFGIVISKDALSKENIAEMSSKTFVVALSAK